MTLEEFFRKVPKAAVAFSGGTDSAFLLWAAKRYGCDVHAYYMKTSFQPDFELEDARKIAECPDDNSRNGHSNCSGSGCKWTKSMLLLQKSTVYPVVGEGTRRWIFLPAGRDQCF